MSVVDDRAIPVTDRVEPPDPPEVRDRQRECLVRQEMRRNGALGESSRPRNHGASAAE